MDPISPFAILSAVNSVGGVAFNLSTKLYSFIKATKVVDKSVEALYHEVKGLENILNTVRTTLTRTERNQAEDSALLGDSAWTSIENAVEDCRLTVEALDRLVQDVGTVAATTNPFKKILKQLKLNLNTDQLVAVKGRIHTHSTCLQLALQTLAVALSCSSTNNINRTVIPDLEVISSKLDLLASTVARAKIPQSSEEAQLPEVFRNPNLRDHTQRLRSNADAVLTTASTVVGSRSTLGDGSQYDPTTFSEFGVPLGSARKAGIEAWTQSLAIGVEESGSQGGGSATGRRSSISIDQSPMPGKGHASRKLENDPDVLIVKRSFEKAQQDWAKANYPEAEKYFRVCLERVKKLRASEQQVFNLNDILLKLAFTCLHQGNVNEAEKEFRSLLVSKGSLKSLFKASAAAAEASRKNHAYFGLAQVHLGQSHLLDAELMCQRCINNWRATTGEKANSLYSKSLQLMALINQAKGDSAVAHLFSGLAVAEGLEANETTPYMLDTEQIQVFVEIAVTGKTAERILSAVNYEISRKDFSPTHALTLVAKNCAGDTIGPGKLGQKLTLTSTDLVRTMRFLLDKGAATDKLLIDACESGNLTVVEQLCEAGADVNEANDDSGYCPLLIAAKKGHLAIVKILCDRGADIERTDGHKRSALHVATTQDLSAIAELLLERHALVDARSNWDRTPLHHAVMNRKLEVVKTMCNAGADLEARSRYPGNYNGGTPLILSLQGPRDIDLEIVKLLCERGADISARLSDGLSASDLARKAGKDVENVLMQYSVKGKTQIDSSSNNQR